MDFACYLKDGQLFFGLKKSLQVVNAVANLDFCSAETVCMQERKPARREGAVDAAMAVWPNPREEHGMSCFILVGS